MNEAFFTDLIERLLSGAPDEVIQQCKQHPGLDDFLQLAENYKVNSTDIRKMMKFMISLAASLSALDLKIHHESNTIDHLTSDLQNISNLFSDQFHQISENQKALAINAENLNTLIHNILVKTKDIQQKESRNSTTINTLSETISDIYHKANEITTKLIHLLRRPKI